MAQTNEGKCSYCNEIMSKRAMKGHLEKCKAINTVKKGEADTKDEERYFRILVEGYGLPQYWIYLDTPAKATLTALDNFLRDIWLECCGHLSAFEIEGIEYMSAPSKEDGERGMGVKLCNVLSAGTQFEHEYDFGSTTTLKLKIVSEYMGGKKRTKVELMARNLSPRIKCAECEKEATQVCSTCYYEGVKAWLCDECMKTHECGEEMFLPVVNSPRTGVCGYSG